MLRTSLRVLFVLCLMMVIVAGSAPAVMYGCFICVQYGSTGITGPSKMECEMTGSNTWGDGWECWDGLGACATNDEPCYRIDVTG